MQEPKATATEKPKPTPSRRRPRRRDKDPSTVGHIDGSPDWMVLHNPDPALHYIWAYEGSTDTGQAYYETLGFDVVYCNGDDSDPDPGGRRIAQKNEPYQSHGHVLMAIAKEEWEDIKARGEDGRTGQQWADSMEDRVRNARADKAEESRLRAAGLRSKPYYGDD